MISWVQRNQKQIWMVLMLSCYLLLFIPTIAFGIYKIKLLLISLPFVLIMSYLCMFHLKFVYYGLVLLLPLSIKIEDFIPGVGVGVPSELIIAFLALFFIFRLILNGMPSRDVMLHPVTLTILVYLGWQWITALTGTMTIVSFKYVLVKSAFILVFYFLALEVIKEYRDIRNIFILYSIGFLLVVGYALFNHAQYNFIQGINPYVMRPLYADHTIYSACASMLIPFFIGHVHINAGLNKWQRFGSILAACVLLVAVVFAFSRAGWLSLLVALGLFTVLALKIPLRLMMVGVFVFLASAWFLREDILVTLKLNKSTSNSSLVEHVESVSNIETDDSNKERINRWKAGIRMFRDKPWLGFGPGTYQFQYSTFQYPHEMTRISTHYGEKGGVHSEYIKPLSESGFTGFFTFLSMVIAVMITGIKLVKSPTSPRQRVLALCLLLGITTYFFHGIFNFFLDTDKSAVLFWGIIASLVYLDNERKYLHGIIKTI